MDRRRRRSAAGVPRRNRGSRPKAASGRTDSGNAYNGGDDVNGGANYGPHHDDTDRHDDTDCHDDYYELACALHHNDRSARNDDDNAVDDTRCSCASGDFGRDSRACAHA